MEDITFEQKYAHEWGPFSPINVECEDKSITLEDFFQGDELKSLKQALITLFSYDQGKGNYFSVAEYNLLEKADQKIDIPKVSLLYGKDYEYITRLLKFDLSASDIFDNYKKNHMRNNILESPYRCIVECVYNDDLRTLEWLNNEVYTDYQRLPWRLAWISAIDLGKLDVLKWLLSMGLQPYPELWDRVIEKGQLDVLKWFKKRGLCPWDTNMCYEAAKHGQLHILKWLRDSNEHKEICPWDKAKIFFSTGDFSIITWLLLEGRFIHSNRDITTTCAYPSNIYQGFLRNYLIECERLV